MSNNKLTDNEIIKALECCKTNRVADCKKCAFHLKERKPNINCVNELIASSIDLINRLQAENRRLKPFEDKIAEFKSHIRVEDMLVFASSLEEWMEFCDNLKAEAYKEFAEKLKFIMYPSVKLEYKDIDNILKELVGDK